jgi:signal transduction histidine kinase
MTSPALSPRDPAASVAPTQRPEFVGWPWRDPLLLSAFLITGVILIYQLVVSLLKPPWLAAGTDWLRAVLAWPEAAVLVLASLWFTRTRQPGALSWWMVSAAVLSYTIAQNLWLVYDVFLMPGQVPFPWWPDPFYLLQYPFFFLALALVPALSLQGQASIRRVKVVLDSILLAAAGTALSWYFILEPIYMHSAQSGLGKATNLAYPVGDLALLVGLAIVFAHQRRQQGECTAPALLLVAVACLIAADSWYAHLNLQGIFQSGKPPDVFWLAAYLFFPLAGLMRLRSFKHQAGKATQAGDTAETGQPWLVQRVQTDMRLLLPFVAALLASAVIIIRAMAAPVAQRSLVAPLAVSFGLLVLVTVRQGITVLENERLQREREAARTNELAMREAARQMDAFLGMASHELKTPLTAVILGLQVLQRRAQGMAKREAGAASEANARIVAFQETLAGIFNRAHQLDQLVNDLLDTSRIRAGRLELHLAPADLAAIVQAVVEEQHQAAPERSIHLCLPAKEQAPVLADADRISQVVTNYLTNALKYSAEDRPVVVGVEGDEQQARVWVRDEGPGLPPAEQVCVWERFHRAPGVYVQAGSEIGLGLGLHISKTIIEQHGGQVGVNSAPGGGSTFWFTLPLINEANPS